MSSRPTEENSQFDENRDEPLKFPFSVQSIREDLEQFGNFTRRPSYTSEIFL